MIHKSNTIFGKLKKLSNNSREFANNKREFANNSRELTNNSRKFANNSIFRKLQLQLMPENPVKNNPDI